MIEAWTSIVVEMETNGQIWEKLDMEGGEKRRRDET